MNDEIYYLDEKEELKLLRLLGMRVWNLKKKVAKFQEKGRKTETKKTLKKDDQELVIIDK
jgi:rRNA pseudouridine-1189 N-methylase Emg1 (Nep1/Mra1 family)